MGSVRKKQRWKVRPTGSNWGNFGPDDQLGRLNLLTPAKVLEAVQEVRTGHTLSLSLPLDLPGGNVLNPYRFPPVLKPIVRPDRRLMYLHKFMGEHKTTDVVCDDVATIYLQYSTQWDALAHYGLLFDANSDGVQEICFYNGFGPEDFETNLNNEGQSRAFCLGIEKMAAHGVQGRGVLVDLRRHFGDQRVAVGYRDLITILEVDRIEVRPGDLLCFHTGFSDLISRMAGKPDAERLSKSCAVLDGRDVELLQWITSSGIAAIIADNYAVEARPYDFIGDCCSALLPLHEHCLFKLGIHLGELWNLTELAVALHDAGRSAFLLTAPPLRLPGAVGSPVNPIATL